MELYCLSFAHNEMIPTKYTCDGEGISPPLKWEGVPPETKSFALIMDDPDAPSGDFVHWVIFSIPAESDFLEEDIETAGELPSGMKQGKNSGGRLGYTPPCPPSGTHRYFFKLYALNAEIKLKAGISKQDLLNAMQGHILDSAEMIGRYQRS